MPLQWPVRCSKPMSRQAVTISTPVHSSDFSHFSLEYPDWAAYRITRQASQPMALAYRPDALSPQGSDPRDCSRELPSIASPL